MIIGKLMVAFLVVMLSAMTTNAENTEIPKVAPRYLDVNSQTARHYCDSMALDHVEGVWNFIDDGVEVLIRAVNQSSFSNYEIIVVKSADKSIKVGTVIGYLTPTADASKFHMHLYTQKTLKGLLSPKRCSATLSTDKYSLMVRSKETKIKINLIGLLPRFWRIVKFRTDNPAENLPEGLIKIYPSYDGNGTSFRNPRYL